MTSLREVLAHNMKERRKKLKITQVELSERVDVSPYYLSMIEHGKKFPSVGMMERIAKGLEFDSVQLFSMETFPSGTIRKYQREVLKNIRDISNQVLNDKLKELDRMK